MTGSSHLDSNNNRGGGPLSATKRSNATTTELWRNPPLSKQQKYNMTPLPEEFEPTKEESALLVMYETIQNYERQASRLKEEAARAKLAAKDAEFKRLKAEKRNRRKRGQKKKKKRKTGGSDDDNNGDNENDDDTDDDDGSDSDDSDSDMDSDDDSDASDASNMSTTSSQAGKTEEEKLAEKAAARQRKAEMEEDLRKEFLATNTSVEEGISLMRKRNDTLGEQTSLIANISSNVTPPHAFSKTLDMKALNGKVLFPTFEEESSWAPPRDARSPFDGAFTTKLEDFDVDEAQNGSGNNTVAIKFMAPNESKRFSLNIAAPDHDEFESILFHFNPRHFERGGQLVLNNKQEGTWGQAINIPLNQIPLVFGQTSCTLVIQINGEGFDAFLNQKHIARLEHRRELPSGKFPLVLNFPGTDDRGHPESWMVYRVWWGNKPIMAKGDLSGVPGYNSYTSVHPRKLFISGLQRIRKDDDVDRRKAEFERAFRQYGGDRGVTVIAPKNSSFAFIEFETERQCDIALQEMANEYPRISRARRSRHEALQEERAAKEKASGKKGVGGGAAARMMMAKKKPTTSDWD